MTEGERAKEREKERQEEGSYKEHAQNVKRGDARGGVCLLPSPDS